MRFYKKKLIINGCEARGDAQSPYLTRYTLFECAAFQVCLHVFHRSDAPDLHDHPWNFATWILWRGYNEETDEYPFTRRLWPGLLYFRKATHKHRVELLHGQRAVTLVFMGKRKREWGFVNRASRMWQNWKDYFFEKGC